MSWCFSVFNNFVIMFLWFQERAYPFVNTPMDNVSRLQEVLGGRLGIIGRTLGELVGEMVLRLVHDHILPLRITSYAQTVLLFSAQLNKHSAELQVTQLCNFLYYGPLSGLTANYWCFSSVSSVQRCFSSMAVQRQRRLQSSCRDVTERHWLQWPAWSHHSAPLQHSHYEGMSNKSCWNIILTSALWGTSKTN